VLWRAGQNAVNVAGASRNKYTESVLIIVESGAIYALATLVIFVLDIKGDPAGYIGVTGIIQLAVCAFFFVF
jgi:hypothetical protein